MAAQSDTTTPSAEQQKAEREYAEMLGRIRLGDLTVNFRAFRVAGALKSGPHASILETEERAAFRNIMASGDWTGVLDSAKRALERNYASPIAQYDAMAAYQALGKTDEAAVHERILNALLDSIRQSGDGKSPETAYFVVTVQEEYIFLNRVLHVRATSQDWVRKDGHFYDRLAVPDSTTSQVGYLWFNADFDARSDPAAIAAVKDGVLATTTAIRPGDASAFQPAVPGVLSQSGMAAHPKGYVRVSGMQVRVRNGSDVDFKGVEVGGKKYGDIKTGATSDYQEVLELASRYAAVSFVAGSQPMTIRPVGEQTSGGGLFHLTYLVTIRGAQWTVAVEEEAAATLPEGADVPPQPKSAYISPHPAVYKSPDSNPRVPPNTTILDNFDGASAGRASGVQYVQIPGAQSNKRGASFSRKSDSRIEYPQGIPSEGTLEWWINVASGYFYQDFQLHTNQEQALIFSTDAQGGDVTWPGTAKLVVSVYGDVSFFLAANKFNQPPVQPMEPRGTPFRFNSWHAIGVSYGSQGEFIMVDGKVVGSAPKRTQTLGAAGNQTEPLDVPTIGHTVSHFWASHRYDGGGEGTVALFRASSAQKDWYLARGVAPDFRPPDFGSANQPVAQATPSAIPVPPDAGSTGASLRPPASTPPDPHEPATLPQRSDARTQVTGRVVWNEMPVPNARVQLGQADRVSLPGLASAVSAADGTFTLQGPPTGSLMIWISAPSSDYLELTGHRVTIVAGHPNNVGDLGITKKLQLLSPADRATISTTTPALQWAPFPDSVRYDVYVFNDATPQRLLLQSVTDARMTAPHPLPCGQLFRWGVTAYNSSGQRIAGSWGHFTIALCDKAAGTEDFWRDKKPSDWSDGQTQEFLTKSPWVRYFGGLRAVSDVIMNGRLQSFAAGSLAIRWESAALVRDALMRIESTEYNDALARFSRDYYVIAVVRIWSNEGPSRAAFGKTRLSGHWSPELEEELRNARALQPPQQRLWRSPLVLIGNEHAQRAFSVSRLSMPGYEAISPARVESGVKERVSYKITFTGGKVSDIDRNGLVRQVGTVDLIMFPRSPALESGAGDLEFSTTESLDAMAHETTFRAKFSLKDLAEAAPPPDTPIAAGPPYQPPDPPPTVSLGQTIDQVVAILGQPKSVFDLSSKKIYVY
jgi:hypothetical protein